MPGGVEGTAAAGAAAGGGRVITTLGLLRHNLPTPGHKTPPVPPNPLADVDRDVRRKKTNTGRPKGEKRDDETHDRDP